MGEPDISIVMPCYNAANHLEKSVGSVLAQTFRSWELIAVDDGSTDQTGDWLRRVLDDRVRLVQQPNQGVSAARNTGIQHAKGRFIAFLDADDTWHPEFLEQMTKALDDRPFCGIAYCGWQNLGVSGGRGQPFIPPEYEHTGKIEALLGGCRWPIHAAMLRRAVTLESGGFDDAQIMAEDFEFWLRTAIRYSLARVPLVLAFYHHRERGQLSSDWGNMAHYQLRAQRKYLSADPELVRRLGPSVIRRLLYGKMLELGYKSYWARDIYGARSIFREVMKHGYGRLRDWKYMLPSVLPYKLHAWLIGLRDKNVATTTQNID